MTAAAGRAAGPARDETGPAPPRQGIRPHQRALIPSYDPGANRLGSPEDWEHDHRPGRPVSVPAGHLLVQVTNAIPTSRGDHAPGDVIALPHDEARALLRQGYAREVLSTA